MAKRIIKELIEKAPNRRNFVRNLGIASAAVGAAALVDPTRADAQALTDIDILNFALNLEYLEAEFYTKAVTGQTIDQYGINIGGGSGTIGQTTGGGPISFSTTDLTVQRIAQELMVDERTHVALIQNAITAAGGTYVNKPAINLNGLGFGYANESEFLQLSRIFEDIGVTAYGGAAPLLSSAAVIGVAARILATEALHVGNIRYLLTRYGLSDRAMLDGVDIPTPSNTTTPTGTQYFSTDSNAITLTRTPAQVLALAYGAPNAAGGGFFPNGINGNAALKMSGTAATFTGPVFAASPNPIPISTSAGVGYGQTTISWNCPAPTQYIQVHVGSPSGPLFTTNFPSGSMMTGVWASEGMLLFLQDISNGKPLTANNTLATIILRTYATP